MNCYRNPVGLRLNISMNSWETCMQICFCLTVTNVTPIVLKVCHMQMFVKDVVNTIYWDTHNVRKLTHSHLLIISDGFVVLFNDFLCCSGFGATWMFIKIQEITKFFWSNIENTDRRDSTKFILFEILRYKQRISNNISLIPQYTVNGFMMCIKYKTSVITSSTVGYIHLYPVCPFQITLDLTLTWLGSWTCEVLQKLVI